MKKTIILFIILLILSIFIKRPKYIELNDLHIIDKITIKCINNKYKITYREIIPIRDDNGIEYKYKYYYKTTNNINNLSHKKYYIKKAKIVNKCK